MSYSRFRKPSPLLTRLKPTMSDKIATLKDLFSYSEQLQKEFGIMGWDRMSFHNGACIVRIGNFVLYHSEHPMRIDHFLKRMRFAYAQKKKENEAL